MGRKASASTWRHSSSSSNSRHFPVFRQSFKHSSKQNHMPVAGATMQRMALKQFSRIKLKHKPHALVMKQLQQRALSETPPRTVSLDEFIKNSLKFPQNFPTQTARLHLLEKTGESSARLEEMVNSVYPLVHHTTLPLMHNFLEHKMAHGTSIEKELYRGMDIVGFVDRLLKCRPMSFLGANDRYLLPGPFWKKGSGGFEAVGTNREKPPLLLRNFLSYDEMRISALISLSSWSVFVNDGRRKNMGVRDENGRHEREGVIVGQVGARLKKSGVMEYLDCVVSPQQNQAGAGFGSDTKDHVNAVWGRLWEGSLPTYEEASRTFQNQNNVLNQPHGSAFEYIKIGNDLLFNVTVYKKRMAITAEILICEATTRARNEGKKAYIHVVGLGLGVWRASKLQDELFVDAWGDALLNIKNTDSIACVDFSYIGADSMHGVKNGGKFGNSGTVIRFSKRNLHDPVPAGCLLVCNYAWDGNSLPGNEFWLGKVCSTGDSAAASSSCVAEIHNHLINPRVTARSLRVATPDGSAVLWTDYVSKGVEPVSEKRDSQTAGIAGAGEGSVAKRPKLVAKHAPVVAPV